MKYRIQDLIDIEKFQALQDRLNEIYPFPAAIIDNEGIILTATAWQDICTKFHRQNKESEKECIKSDQYILTHLHEANPTVSYKCPHGLIDNATPIIIDGEHLGNFFTGQFFLEEPDMEFFREQAIRFGFDVEAYLEAVRKVPIWTNDQLQSYLLFIRGLIEMLANVGLKNLREVEANRKIRESEELSRSILETSMDGFWMVDLKGHILQANEAYCRMSGYNLDELLSMQISDVEALESPEEVSRHIEDLVSMKFGRFETKHRRKDGTIFDVEVSTQPLQTREGRLVAFLRDITDRKKLEQQLQQAQKMESVGRLAGGVAHDFNNMLSVILGHTEMALEQINTDHPIHTDLVEINKAAERSADLTRQLLTFARKQTISPKVLDLNETVSGMLKMIKRLIGEAIILNWQPGQGLWPVNMDPSQIDQILANLCVNARDAISDSGIITIKTESCVFDDDYCAIHPEAVQGEFVMLSVSDSGCGMDQKTLSQIFEPFFTTKGLGKGTGLGLATLYGIVKQNNGFIQVTTHPGEGTTFKIYLPRYCGPIKSRKDESKLFRSENHHETVLLVEDEPAMLNMVKLMLEKLGCKVHAVSTPMEALALAARRSDVFDLLITDVIMPEMTGKDLADKFQALYPDIQCLFMSGYTADLIARHGVLEEGVHFIPKPFTFYDLAGKIHQILAKT